VFLSSFLLRLLPPIFPFPFIHAFSFRFSAFFLLPEVSPLLNHERFLHPPATITRGAYFFFFLRPILFILPLARFSPCPLLRRCRHTTMILILTDFRHAADADAMPRLLLPSSSDFSLAVFILLMLLFYAISACHFLLSSSSSFHSFFSCSSSLYFQIATSLMIYTRVTCCC